MSSINKTEFRLYESKVINTYSLLLLLLLFQSALQPLVGFRLAQLSLSILNRKVLQSAVVSGTSKLGGEPGN
jgi:hypothetical protein